MTIPAAQRQLLAQIQEIGGTILPTDPIRTQPSVVESLLRKKLIRREDGPEGTLWHITDEGRQAFPWRTP